MKKTLIVIVILAAVLIVLFMAFKDKIMGKLSAAKAKAVETEPEPDDSEFTDDEELEMAKELGLDTTKKTWRQAFRAKKKELLDKGYTRKEIRKLKKANKKAWKSLWKGCDGLDTIDATGEKPEKKYHNMIPELMPPANRTPADNFFISPSIALF
jgi:trehalose/maltose hydrolase-like predicted phosphorylase